MVSMNGNGNGRPKKPIVVIPPEGSLERLLYDMDGLFGLVAEYKGKKKGRTFSNDGIEGIVVGFQRYISAQIARRWNETEKPPTQMTIMIDIKWDIDEEMTESIGTVIVGEDN